MKENCQTNNYGKFGKNLLLKNCVPFSLHLSIRTSQIMPEGGNFASFFRPWGRSFALKSCPWGGDFDGKIGGPGVSPGGW